MALDNKKLMVAALGLGATYLMRNKDARTKLINGFQSLLKRGSNKPVSSTDTNTIPK
jgi:hypothetical protein